VSRVTAIDLLLHPESDVHFPELVQVLGAALSDLGCDVELLSDGRLHADDARAIVAVAPHEIYPRFRELGESLRIRVHARQAPATPAAPGGVHSQ
jgi:hypothetical protein